MLRTPKMALGVVALVAAVLSVPGAQAAGLTMPRLAGLYAELKRLTTR